MSDADTAYAAAEAAIKRAAQDGVDHLSFDDEEFHALTRLPPGIAKLAALTTLDFDNTQISDLAPLADLTGITSLTLDNTRITDLAPLAGMAGMTSLTFNNTRVKDLTPLAGMTGMKGLDLQSTPVSDLTPLAGLTEVTGLTLHDTQITDITPLAGMTGMTTLRLHNTQITDLTPLAGMTGITTLYLENTQITDLTPLAGMTGITQLLLSNTQITDLTPLAGMTGITRLDLDNTQITDLTPLAGMTRITRLSLNSTQITDLTPLAGMTGITTLWLNNTQITDITPLAGMTGITTLWLNNTQIKDITPLAGMTGITTLWLDNTQITDLAPLAGMTEIKTLRLNSTQIADLRPLTHLRQLAENPSLLGLTFQNCRAAQRDSRIAQIAEISDNAERAQTLFDYLNDGWVPPVEEAIAQDDDIRNDVSVPPRKPAPLELAISDTQITLASKPGLPLRDANDRAALGWDALTDLRSDLESAFNVSNYQPLPSYLAAFDRAMGDSYDPARVVKIGNQAMRLSALAHDTPFTQNLPDGAVGDLRLIASEMLVYVNRFPDWIAYRDDSQSYSRLDFQEIADALREIQDALSTTAGVSPEVREEYADEVSQAQSETATDVEAKAVTSSVREVYVGIGQHEAEARRERRALADKGGDFLDSVIRGPIGVPYHLAKKLRKPSKRLSQKYPTAFKWLDAWYDSNFGDEDEDQDKKE